MTDEPQEPEEGGDKPEEWPSIEDREGERMDAPETLVPRPSRRGPRAMVVLVLIAILVGVGLWRWAFRGRIDSRDPGLADVPEQQEPRDTPPKREPLVAFGEILLEDYPEGHDPTAPPEMTHPPDANCRVRAWKDGVRLASADACVGPGMYELEFDREVAGTVAVEIWATGYLRAVVEVELEGRGRVEMPTVVLGRGHVLAGQAVDFKRQPLAGVVIEARPDPDLDEPIPWRTVSDEAGNFKFDNMPFGPAIMRGSKEGFAESVVEAVVPTDEVLVVMEELVDLKGQVIADATLLKTARARVEGSGVWPPVEVDVAADGSFTFPGLIDGVYGVEAYVEVDPANPDAPLQEWASIPLENVQPSMRVTLAFTPAYRVPAKVVDPEGAPVPGARVTVANASLGLLQKIETTELDGTARVGPVVPGPYWLRADADGYLPAAPKAVDVLPDGGPDGTVELVLARPATLAGMVVDEDGNPVAGAQVRLESDELFSLGEVEARADLVRSALRKGEEGIGSLGVTTGPVPPIPTESEPDMVGGEAWLSAMTDGAGNFRFEMLAPGKYRMVARDGAHAESKELEVELASGQLKDEVVLKLREGSPLTGRVLDANGQPIANVMIEAGAEMFLTDETGSFDLGLRRGKVRVIARAPGMVPKAVEAKVKGEAIDLAIELEPADGAVDLRLVDANGTPISNVEVMLQSKDRLTPTVIAWSDDAGRVQLDQLTPGKSVLRLGHPEYVMQEMNFEVEHQSASLGLEEVTMDPGWSVEVIVRARASGERLKDALVVIDGRGATTDEDGKVEITRLDAKRIQLEVKLEGWATSKTKVRRPKDASREEVTIELDEVGSLEGTLRDDIGDPVVGAKLRALDAKGKELATTSTVAGGVFRFASLPEGEVRIVAPVPPDKVDMWVEAGIDSDVRRGETTKEVHLRFERP